MADLAKRFSILAGAVAVVLVMQPTTGVSVEQRQLESTEPEVQQMPQVAPGQPKGPPQATPTTPAAPLRTHCNGTCMCTGKDCNADWKKANCEGSATCSGSYTEEETTQETICTCVNKAKAE
jgi:hypothetical protein